MERAIQCKDCCEKASGISKLEQSPTRKYDTKIFAGVPDSDQKCLTRCYLESTYRNEHIITCASSVE